MLYYCNVEKVRRCFPKKYSALLSTSCGNVPGLQNPSGSAVVMESAGPRYILQAFHQTAERSRASRHYSYTFGLAYPLSLLLPPVERDVVPSPDTGRAGTQLCESTLALPNLYSCRQTTCAGGGGALFFSQPKRQNKHMVVEHPDTFLCLPIAVPGCHLHRWLTDDEQLCRNWLRASNAG